MPETVFDVLPLLAGGMGVFLFGIALILVGGIAAVFLPERLRIYAPAVSSGLALVPILYSVLPVLMGGTAVSLRLTLGYPIGEVILSLDPLSAFFAALIAAAGFPGVLYAIGYMRPYIGRGMATGAHVLFLCVFIASMLVAVVLKNALAFLIAWEIMSLSSFFLVIFEHGKESTLRAGIYYLIATHVGVIFLIAGFALLSLRTGSMDFDAFRAVAGTPEADIVFILLFIGFGLKAGFVPFHTWLPKAHPAAPSHVSGLMSGIMIKLGIYGILRALMFHGTPSAGMAAFVLGISIVTAVAGVMYAIAQHDLKRLLAYHSVENIGIIGIGIGVGMMGLAFGNPAMAALGFAGGILHVLNHSIFKGLLFYGAGAVYLKTHTLDIEKLGGLARRMRMTAVFFLIGSLAISGLPPFNGFVSELLIYLGMLNGVRTPGAALTLVSALSICSLAVVGAMAFLCFTKAFGVVFLGSPRSTLATEPDEVEGTMLWAMGLLAFLCAAIGFLPQYAVRLAGAVVMQVAGLDSVVFDMGVNTGILCVVSCTCILFLGVFLSIYAIRGGLLKGKAVTGFKTWDCGYQAGTARMQYTASSYAGPFVGLVRLPLGMKTSLHPPEGLFPRAASLETEPHDAVERWSIDPMVRGIRRFLDLFSWIQSGNTQQYVLYGLIFLMLVLCWIMGVK